MNRLPIILFFPVTVSAVTTAIARVLFEQRGLFSGGPIPDLGTVADGRGFLMVQMEERKPQPVTEMILVQNWFEELKRLCRPKEVSAAKHNPPSMEA